MKILVAIKQFGARFAPGDGRIGTLDRGSRPELEINEPDAYALEEALQLKEKHGGEVVRCAPDRLARSRPSGKPWPRADRAIHIEAEDLGAFDTLGIARLLAEAARPENPDLILTGLQSDDLGYGQTGVVLAELMGLPHSTIIMQVDVVNKEGGAHRFA